MFVFLAASALHPKSPPQPTPRQVTFEILSTSIVRIDVSVRQAERVYRSVLTRHPNSVKLLRLYARFLLDIKNDPWTAAKWLT